MTTNVTSNSFVSSNLGQAHFDEKIYSLSKKDIDSYTQETFEDLYKGAQEKFCTLYVAVVTDNDPHHLFDAYSFLLNLHKNQEIETLNPLTGLPISNYSIYKVTNVTGTALICERVYAKAELEQDIELHRLPILWNSPKCSDHNRLVFMLTYAQNIEKSNPIEALDVAKRAAELGSTAAKYYLSAYFCRNDNKGEARNWLREAIKEDQKPSVHNLLLYAFYLKQDSKDDEAFHFNRLAAEKGSFWGILEVLKHVEGQETLENMQEWRSKLPREIRNASLVEIGAYLKKIQYPFNHIGNFPG